MSDAATPEPAPAADHTPPPAAADDIAAQLAALTALAEEWKGRALRQQAEFDNVRKRLRKEADEAGTRAIARALRPVLEQIDNLERALAAATPDRFAEFAQGVTLIRDGLASGLAAQGLERIACDGVFDPAQHEVLAEQDQPDTPKGSILAIHRSGWRLRDQLVRTAQVVVAKG